MSCFLENQAQLIFDWSTTIGKQNTDVANDVSVDPSGKTVTTGFFLGDSIDFDPGVGVFNLSASSESMYVRKLGVNGGLVWAYSFDNGTRGNGVHTDQVGNVYLTGTNYFGFDADPSVGVENIGIVGDQEAFVIKLNWGGGFVWAQDFNSTDEVVGSRVKTDPMTGDVYVSGYFTGTADFDPGSGSFVYTSNGGWDAFVLKLSSGGDVKWVKTFGSTADVLHADKIYDLEVDTNGDVYCAGAFSTTVDFDPGVGVTSVSSVNSSYDAFLLKLDSLGDFKWVKTFGSGAHDRLQSISLDNAQNVYASGFFSDQMDADPGTSSMTLVSNGQRDIFVSKFDTNGNLIWSTSVGGNDDDEGKCISYREDGTLCLATSFNGLVDFDPTANIDTVSSSNDALGIWCLDTLGNYLWVNEIESSERVVPNSLATGPLGEVRVCGFFDGLVEFGPTDVANSYNGSEDAFLVAYNLVVIDAGVTDVENPIRCKVFPNPVAEELFIKFENEEAQYGFVRILDMNGRVLHSQTLSTSVGLSIPVSGLTKGVYLLELKLNDQSKTVKFIKK